jgi:hypothetical protein
MTQLYKVIRSIWKFLCEASGENNYARYRSHLLALGEQPLGPRDFYLEQVQREYSRPSHCC